MFDRLRNDIRFALRMLRKSPLFAAVAVLAISVGSGAVTTIFSAMNALVLRPLPGANGGDRVVALEFIQRTGRSEAAGSNALYEYLRNRARSTSSLDAWTKITFSINAGPDATVAAGNLVSANFFSTLGVRPAIGRFFAPEEGRTRLTHPVIVVSHSFWASHLGADSAAIGRALTVNGHVYTLIGVAPAEFRGVTTVTPIDAWVPLMMRAQLQPESSEGSLRVFGRLRDGVELSTAQAELTTLAAGFTTSQGVQRSKRGTTAVRLSTLRAIPADARGSFLGFLGLLLGAAALVLVIASVNVASLLSARALARRREMALRAALGASRGRLVAQLLTEVAVLFVLGAAGGVALAFAATRAATLVSLPTTVVAAPDMSPDWRVMAFSLAVSLSAGVVFGLAPALRTARSDISLELRDGSAGSGSRRSVAGNALIVGQLALSLVLLVAAGLFLRALSIGARVDPGFDRAGVWVANFDSRSWGYENAKGRRAFDDVIDRIAAVPGVSSVSMAAFAPLTTRSANDSVSLEDGTRMLMWETAVNGDYFSVLRIRIVAGRALARTDNEGAAKVAVVNETFAKRLSPDGSVLGHTFLLRGSPVSIVGIVRDAKYADLTESTPPLAYLSLDQFWQPNQTLLVRSTLPSPQVARVVDEALRAVDGNLPRANIASLETATGIILLPQRIAAIVTGVLGGVGLLLAALGLYGIIAYSVNRRTREMGVRVALGATNIDVLGLVLREGMRLAVGGVVIGLGLAAVATRLISSFLFDVSALDPTTFAGMSFLFVSVALLATYFPARRAARLDPMAALRIE